jgi:hypothetical protein
MRAELQTGLSRSTLEWYANKHGVVTQSDFLTKEQREQLNGPVTRYIDTSLIRRKEGDGQRMTTSTETPRRDAPSPVSPQTHTQHRGEGSNEAPSASAYTGGGISTNETAIMDNTVTPEPPIVRKFTKEALEQALNEGKRQPELLAMFGIGKSVLYGSKRAWGLTKAMRRRRQEDDATDNTATDVATLEKQLRHTAEVTLRTYSTRELVLRKQIEALTKEADEIATKRKALEYTLERLGRKAVGA